MLIIVLLGIYTFITLTKYEVTAFYFNCAPGISYYWLGENRPYSFLFMHLLLVVVLYLIARIGFNKENNFGKRMIIGLIICNFIMGISLQNNYLKNQETYSVNYDTVTYIQERDQEGTLYVYGLEDNKTSFWIDCSILQYMLYDKPFQIWKGEEILENDILIVSNSTEYLNDAPDNMKIVMEERSYVVFESGDYE